MYTPIDKNAQRIHRHRRIRAKISGTAARPRVSVYRSNRYIYASLIDDEKGITLCSSASNKLGLENAGNCQAAAALGADLASKAKALNIETVVFDRSGYAYHGQVEALAESLRENGLVF